MEQLFISIGTVVAWLGILIGLTRSLHILQQNSYRATRYFRWAKTAGCGRTVATVLSAGVLGVLAWLCGYGYALFALLFGYIRFAKNKAEQKKAIKPLVFTSRIKRQYATAILLGAAVCACSFLFADYALWFALGSCAFFAFTPLLALLVLTLNRPLEKLVTRYYINDAKKILKASPNMKILGVTGSYGKTTTKFMITRLLEEKYRVTVTPESFNTPMGIVRTIREKMKPGTQIFVVEMGAKQVGDIKEICKIVHPTYGVITSVGPQHLDTFHSLDNIIKTKFELADFVEKAKGTMFLNYDSQPVTTRKVEGAVTYGVDAHLDAYAKDIVYSQSGASFTVCVGEEEIPLETRLLGHHAILNLTVATAVARHFGVAIPDIRYAVSTMQPTPHRLEAKAFVKGALMIDDAYNANPEGCLEAVNVLSRFENKTKIIITPGLVELGDKEEECNFNLGAHAGKLCDIIVLVGKNRSKPIADGVRSTDFDKKNLLIAASFKEAVKAITPLLNENCVVLVENDLPDNYLY